MKRFYFLLIVLALTIGALASKRYWLSYMSLLHPQKTVSDRLQEFGPAAQTRLIPYFQKARIGYPPTKLILVGIKNEKRLEIYASGSGQPVHFVRSYPILCASGKLGPKLQEGDGQVPEGIYAIESLNPNSRFHLALRVGYPNQFDREQAQKDGRSNLGGDIMIHGKNVSIGCLAMGDEAAEDLFVLAAQVGIQNIEAILTPVDFRREQLPSAVELPVWTKPLYEKIKTRLAELPLPH